MTTLSVVVSLEFLLIVLEFLLIVLLVARVASIGEELLKISTELAALRELVLRDARCRDALGNVSKSDVERATDEALRKADAVNERLKELTKRVRT